MNPRTGSVFRAGQLLRIHANKVSVTDELATGDIAAIVGAIEPLTGDTLCTPGLDIVLEALEIPEPVMSMALHPMSQEDQTTMQSALVSLQQEDPSLHVQTDEHTGHVVVAGMGELHLDILVDRLRREYSVSLTASRPEVTYRETVTQTSQNTGQVNTTAGQKGIFAEIAVTIEPAEPGTAAVDTSNIEGKISREYIAATNETLQKCINAGVIAGYPMTGLRVQVTDAKEHSIDSNVVAFELAAALAFRGAATQAGLRLLEPIMALEVVVPIDFVGDVMGDINSRRGQVTGMDSRGTTQVIRADVPLREMFGFATDLRSKSQGRATYTMQLTRFDPLPKSIGTEMTAIS